MPSRTGRLSFPKTSVAIFVANVLGIAVYLLRAVRLGHTCRKGKRNTFNNGGTICLVCGRPAGLDCFSRY